MSDDPETARQIAELARDHRPLLVLDVDDVILDFIRPFPRYLAANGYSLTFESFRLNGNIREISTGRAAGPERVGELIDTFFETQADWQGIVDGAAEFIAQMGERAEIVLLTAMPHRHRETRRRHLLDLGLGCPLLTTEMAKGPAISALRGSIPRAVAFVDDQPRNLLSAREAVPDAHLFHLMADNSLRPLLPPPPDGIHVVEDWHEAGPRIAASLGL